MPANIHPTALISPDATVPTSAEIGPYSVLHPGVVLGENTKVSEYCVLGGGPLQCKEPLYIGPGSIVRSHSVIYAGSHFEDRLETGHHVVIRETTHAGKNLRVGNFSDIEGSCEIGDFCRFHCYTHIAKGSSILNIWGL
jgi:UDP-3-O-[3-hydroxymyristoyl] glucosamine N-acyltransferase